MKSVSCAGAKWSSRAAALAGFLACPGFPECKNTKPLVERMPGRCPRCGSGMLKRKSKKGYVYYACERGAECGVMTWDVPTAQDCPELRPDHVQKIRPWADEALLHQRKVPGLPAGG